MVGLPRSDSDRNRLMALLSNLRAAEDRHPQLGACPADHR